MIEERPSGGVIVDNAYFFKRGDPIIAAALEAHEHFAKQRDDARVDEAAAILYEGTYGAKPLTRGSVLNPYRLAARALLKAIDDGLV